MIVASVGFGRSSGLFSLSSFQDWRLVIMQGGLALAA
jgi:hypothetical protein